MVFNQIFLYIFCLFLTKRNLSYTLIYFECASSTVTVCVSRVNWHTCLCTHINNQGCVSAYRRSSGCLNRQDWSTQIHPHMSPLTQLLPRRVLFYQRLLWLLYIWPRLPVVLQPSAEFCSWMCCNPPTALFNFLLSPSPPCSVSIWRANSEGHSRGRGHLEKE